MSKPLDSQNPRARKISAVIITLNEEKRIKAAIDSVAWADEILVLDSGSEDATVAIAKAAGARVEHRDFDGFGSQKRAAVARASHDWIFSIDADEVASAELARAVAHCNFAADHYAVERCGTFLNRPARPMHRASRDLPVRFFDRNTANFSAAVVHEAVTGRKLGMLSGTITHKSFESVADMAEKFNKYSSLLIVERARRHSSSVRILGRPLMHFLWSYFWRGALIDGRRGLILSLMWAYHDFLVEAKAFEESVIDE